MKTATIKTILCALAIGAVWFFQSGGAGAYFAAQPTVSPVEISLGDWTAPELEIIRVPEESLIYGNMRLFLTATDDYSRIKKFSYAIYPEGSSDLASDWVIKNDEHGCADEECDSKREDAALFFALDTVENPHHPRCASSGEWCAGKPLPAGEYFVSIFCYDASSTTQEEGNRSREIIYRFEKRHAAVICGLNDIRARAGDDIVFPCVHCQGEPELVEVIWEVEADAEIEHENPILLTAANEAATLAGGLILPGTYKATVTAKNKVGNVLSREFIVDIANPFLNLGDLIINEFLPDPNGEDSAHPPGGEWVEIMNTQDVYVDLLGFILYDGVDQHDLPITKNTGEGNTLIAPAGYKVVFRGQQNRFSLNNSGAERVRLVAGFLDNWETLLAEAGYAGPVKTGMSLARHPNGTGEFVSGVPTPLKQND